MILWLPKLLSLNPLISFLSHRIQAQEAFESTRLIAGLFVSYMFHVEHDGVNTEEVTLMSASYDAKENRIAKYAL